MNNNMTNLDTDTATDTESIQPSDGQKYKEENGVRYYPYTSDFVDADDNEVRKTLYFRKPQRQHVLRIAKAGKDKVYDTQKEILVELSLPTERAEVREFFEQYPLVAGSFGDEVFRAAGAGSVFKGK